MKSPEESLAETVTGLAISSSWLRQLGDVGRNAPRLIFAEQLGSHFLCVKGAR
jgi:hypothetical protein